MTEQTVNVRPRLDVQKELAVGIFQNSVDKRYLNKDYNIFAARSANDFGKVKFSPDFNDRTVSIIGPIIEELNELADRFNIPRLRGIKSGKGRYVANQGDGVMQFNAESMNAYADPNHKINKPDRFSTWAPGDPLNERPFTAEQYFDNGVDKIRQTLYHEFGHHVHQFFRKFEEAKGTTPQIDSRRMPWDNWWNRTQDPRLSKALKMKQHTRYAGVNKHEWFAENFSLYFMGKKSRVDPNFVQMIESMLQGKMPGDDQFNVYST